MCLGDLQFKLNGFDLMIESGQKFNKIKCISIIHGEHLPMI